MPFRVLTASPLLPASALLPKPLPPLLGSRAGRDAAPRRFWGAGPAAGFGDTAARRDRDGSAQQHPKTTAGSSSEADETAPAILAAHLPGAAVLPGAIWPGGLCKSPFGNAKIPLNSRELLEGLNGADTQIAPQFPFGQLSPRNSPPPPPPPRLLSDGQQKSSRAYVCRHAFVLSSLEQH